MPLVRPSLIFTGHWTALSTFREVTIALFLSESHNRVLSVNIWYLWLDGDFGIAAAGSVVMVVIMGALMWFSLRMTGGSPLGQQRGGMHVVR